MINKNKEKNKFWDFPKECFSKPERKMIFRIYQKLPDPHLAFYQWRFTIPSLENIDSELIKNNPKSICFLGCPLLSLYFGYISQAKILIADIDNHLLSIIKKYINKKSNLEFLSYDVQEDIPDEYRKRFEIVYRSALVS